MTGGVYALTVNASIALLFAVAFGVVQLSYPAQRGVFWFCASYLLGMLTPLSEIAVRFADWDAPFVFASYASLLLSVLAMPLGLAAVAGRPLPWRAVGVIFVCGIALRLVIWGGPRDHLTYELSYQAAFTAASLLSMLIAVNAVRRTGGRLWLAVAIVFGFMVAYFTTKPFFASFFGSGATAKLYTSSAYALVSQAAGGVLIIAAGLLVLLIVVEVAIGRTILESETDPLTAVANRRGFERRAKQQIADAQRTGLPLAVVLFDLDHFKRINDRHGHSTGDAVIRRFAMLLGTTAPTATIARLGGEEFVVLMERTTLRGAWRAAHAIRSALPDLGAPLPLVTVSGGLAELLPDDTLETLLDRADQWTYAAKAAGRNCIRPAPEGPPATLRAVQKSFG